MGDYDECGICNGPGDIYECGCTEPSACNYDQTAIATSMETSWTTDAMGLWR